MLHFLEKKSALPFHNVEEHTRYKKDTKHIKSPYSQIITTFEHFDYGKNIDIGIIAKLSKKMSKL